VNRYLLYVSVLVVVLALLYLAVLWYRRRRTIS